MGGCGPRLTLRQPRSSLRDHFVGDRGTTGQDRLVLGELESEPERGR